MIVRRLRHAKLRSSGQPSARQTPNGGCRTRVFRALDDYLWKLTYKWACWTHSNKPKGWIVGRYFRKFAKFRNDRWVFGDESTGAYLPRLAWTDIVRHTLAKGRASPDDPALASYWAIRRRRGRPPLGPFFLRLLQSQNGRCPGCGSLLLHADQQPQSPDEWELWLKGLRKAIRREAVTAPGGPPDENARCLIHASCAKRRNAARAARPQQLPPEPSGLA